MCTNQSYASMSVLKYSIIPFLFCKYYYFKPQLLPFIHSTVYIHVRVNTFILLSYITYFLYFCAYFAVAFTHAVYLITTRLLTNSTVTISKIIFNFYMTSYLLLFTRSTDYIFIYRYFSDPLIVSLKCHV